MPSKNLVSVKAHVTPEEKSAIKNWAAGSNLTVSSYARRILTGKPIPDASKQLNIKELLNTAADLARLGNLFKMAVEDDDFNMFQKKHGHDALSVMQAIQATNADLKGKIRDLIKA